jgi:exosome complex component MTR3
MRVCIGARGVSSGAVAAALSCASLALADAGIELYDLVAACTLVQFGCACVCVMLG